MAANERSRVDAGWRVPFTFEPLAPRHSPRSFDLSMKRFAKIVVEVILGGVLVVEDLDAAD